MHAGDEPRVNPIKQAAAPRLPPSIHVLHGFPQNYAWGRPAADSEVAKLLAGDERPVNPALPYAELWWGTHPSGPARTTEGTLPQLIAQDPKGHLGEHIIKHWGAELPFLLKVLSVAQALSIQAHPDIERAKVLHKNKPTIYKDPNHKPELALALSPFEALCQFRPAEEICDFLSSVPEFRRVVGSAAASDFTAHKNATALRTLFHALMTADVTLVAALLIELIERLKHATDPLSKLIVRLHAQYPGDVGVFCPFVLNYIVLQPGEALYLAPNEPHAYLSGECLECMATSDNVVRAGLTPKLKDVETLCEMLTYAMGMPHVLRGEKKLSPIWTTYRGAAPEFQVHVLRHSAGDSVSHGLGPSKQARILLVLEGECFIDAEGAPAYPLRRGNSLFLSAHHPSLSLRMGTQPATVVLAEPCL